MEASRNSTLLTAILVILVMTGCSNNYEADERKIEVHLIESNTEPPSKVRLFFKIDTDIEDTSYPIEEPDFEIFENGSQISNLESQARIRKEPGEFLYSSLLLLDLSGSILNNSDLPRVKEAAATFIERTMPEKGEGLYGTREMAVYWFDGEEDIHSLVDFTPARDDLLAGIDSIHNQISDDVSTNLNGAVTQGLSLMNSRLQQTGSDSGIAIAGSMVLFTDGTDQAGRVSRAEALDSINHAGREHSLFSIGLGGEIDPNTLELFGRDGFELAADSLALRDSFLAVAERLERMSNSYYVLEYCSPKRAGQHVLQLRALYENQFGSFNMPFSAEGFTGGCSIN